MNDPLRHAPTKPIPERPRSSATQADRRYLDTFFDTHVHARKAPDGRPWWGHREFPAMPGQPDGFIGGDLLPGNHDEPFTSGWDAPILPEIRFAQFNYLRKTIRWRYDKMKAHDQFYYDTYFKAAAKVSYHMQLSTEIQYGVLPRPNITAIVGDPPRSPRVANLLLGGDEWLLGFTTEVNETAADLLGFNVLGLKIVRAEHPALIKPEQVLASTPDQLAQMLDEMRAMREEIAAMKSAAPTSRKRTRGPNKPKPVITEAVA